MTQGRGWTVGSLVAALALVAGIAVAVADDRSSEPSVPGAPVGAGSDYDRAVLREDGQHQLHELVNQERRERNAAQSRRERDEMRSARWLPDEGGQGCGYSGVLPDGKPIHVVMMVCVPGRDAEEFLDEAYGP